MHEYYVYVLLCNDGTYYTGVTNDYHRRFDEHVRGDDPHCYTFSRRPLQLVYVEIFQQVFDAIEREKQMKNWSKAKKEALIRNDTALLERLSRNANYNEYMSQKRSSTSSERQNYLVLEDGSDPIK